MLQVIIVPVTAFAQNCSLVWDSETKEAVLIDAGGDAAVLKKEVEALGLKVKALWLTHGHLDHAGAVGELAKEWSVPVVGPHKEDQFWLDMIQEVSARYGFPIPQPVKVDQWLEGGEVLKLGEDEFEVRFAPGHTPGHVMFYNKNHGLLWTGDVLFKGSIGRTDFPRGNHEQLIESIQRECFSLPDETQFISGHGPMSTIGYEKQFNPFVAGKAG
ncbi:MBL fold metallo-hydrolase [Acinetobacter baumannii]|uniref:MBL fold metallo-hydrolase n=1 Tax=Acinetobacter baumannii TaxID=470 RepID=UPI0010FCF333|nr:MBL fold metallo-hydrolase [Acinetobacter baumannii]MDV2219339.1 MBL fold metallo-hydrolase [Acinetobacter baumannii]MDV2942262.1 MBL fold metallo-hydrolase [Acinetobacter baumannii]TLT89660.1 MBL fold metallo-hydrolase [Acinetobacter baumannii]